MSIPEAYQYASAALMTRELPLTSYLYTAPQRFYQMMLLQCLKM